MSAFWDKVRQLQGQVLLTKTGKRFQIVLVDDQSVTVKPEQTGNSRPIRRQEVEAAYSLQIPLSELTAARLIEGLGTSFKPVYIVAILKAIEGVAGAEPKPKTAIPVRLQKSTAEEFISQLERISQLHGEGILSDSDFAQAKLKLLKVTE